MFFVNAKNTVSHLDVSHIRAIYSGKIANWRDAGGPNQTIRLFQRQEGSGSQTAFLRVMGDTAPLPPKMEDKRRVMSSIIREAADYKNYGDAIGFSLATPSGFLFCTFARSWCRTNTLSLSPSTVFSLQKKQSVMTPTPLSPPSMTSRAGNRPGIQKHSSNGFFLRKDNSSWKKQATYPSFRRIDSSWRKAAG